MNNYKLTLKKQPPVSYNPYPIYLYIIDGIECLRYQAPKKVIKNLFQRYKIGLGKIPKGAKLLITKEDRKLFDTMILGGWVCSKLSFTYGIYLASQDRILTAPQECLYWTLGQEEIEKFTNYTRVREATRRKEQERKQQQQEEQDGADTSNLFDSPF